MAVFLLQTTWYDDMSAFLEEVFETFGWLDAVLRLQTTIFIHTKKYDDALSILSSNCFPTYATDRSSLMSLWHSAVEAKANAVSELDKHEARAKTPIPKNIGCNKGSKYCLNYW